MRNIFDIDLNNYRIKLILLFILLIDYALQLCYEFLSALNAQAFYDGQLGPETDNLYSSLIIFIYILEVLNL